MKKKQTKKNPNKDWESNANGLTYGEGFQLIQYLDQDVALDVSEFQHPGLIVDAQTILTFKLRKTEDFGFDVSLVPGVFDSLKEWKMMAPKGRVIVLIDDDAVLPSLVTAEADSPEVQLLMIRSCHEQIFSCLQTLQCNIPLYYYHIHFGAFEPKSFHKLTGPGPISWICRRHRLLLSKSLWIAPCPKNSTTYIPFGIPYIAATEFFATSGWDMASKLRQFRIMNPSLPDWLSCISPLSSSPQEPFEADHSIDLEQEETRVMPLEAERQSLLQDNPDKANDWIMVSEDISFGRVHGCWFPPIQKNKKRRSSTENGSDFIANASPAPKRPQDPSSALVIEIKDSSSSIPIFDIASQEAPSTKIVIEIDTQDS
jgi:hypothetical protein